MPCDKAKGPIRIRFHDGANDFEPSIQGADAHVDVCPCALEINAGIVDEHVDAARASAGIHDQRGNFVCSCQIKPKCLRGQTLILQFADGQFASVRVPAGENDPETEFGEMMGGRQAHSSVGPSHDRNFFVSHAGASLQPRTCRYTAATEEYSHVALLCTTHVVHSLGTSTIRVCPKAVCLKAAKTRRTTQQPSP